MPRELTYRVENAQVVNQTIETEFEGAPAVLTVSRAVIECLPTDAAGKTFTMVLPADALAEFPEGAVVTVAVTKLAD